jgi:hypothetical protein
MEESSNHRLTPRAEYSSRFINLLGYFMLALSLFKLYLGLGQTIHAPLSKWLTAARETAPDLLAAFFCFKFAMQNRNWASENSAPSLLRKDARELAFLAWLLGAALLPWPYGPFVSALFCAPIYAWSARKIRSRERVIETDHLIEVIKQKY